MIIRELTPDELDMMEAEENADRAAHQIPDHMLDSLKTYVERRRETGGFIRAVLENDLKEACGRADSSNRRLLFEYVQWLYNEAPSDCWGSKDKVAKWLGSDTEKDHPV